MTTAADQIDEWLSTMEIVAYFASAFVLVGLVAIALRFMVQAGRSV